MDTIIKRENCLKDSKLAKQAMMCSCVCWPRDTKRTKSSDGRPTSDDDDDENEKQKMSIL